MTTGKVTITAPNGMHARPAGELVKLIRGLAPARITLRTAAREASAVSILSLLALGLKHGTEVEVCAEGGDEAAAVQAALFLHLCGADGHHLVAVNDAALLVDGQAAVGVAVERDAEVIAAGFDRVTERFQMR